MHTIWSLNKVAHSYATGKVQLNKYLMKEKLIEPSNKLVSKSATFMASADKINGYFNNKVPHTIEKMK